jgi:hypothetical protein
LRELAVRYSISARQNWVSVTGDDDLPGTIDVEGLVEAESGGELMLFPFFQDDAFLRLADGTEIPVSYFGKGKIRFTETKPLAKYFPSLA